MTLSRRATAGAVLLIAGAPAAALPPPSAEALLAAQQDRLRAVIRPACPRDAGGEEIVVCGRRDDQRYRVPPQIVPGSVPAGARAGGEQLAAMGANDQRCAPIGRDQRCNGGLNVIGIGLTIARAVAQALANRD